jgi:hypothetical protein
MPYITEAQARNRSRAQWANSRIAESEVRKSAAAPIGEYFDVFLSHSYSDIEIITGVKGFIEDQGMSVYVDWIDDPQADRENVTPATASLLRRRMNNSNALLYISSDAAKRSRWMPWELGYFDGRKPGCVAVVPIVEWPGKPFLGQEYLGLYPYVELIDTARSGLILARDIDKTRALPLRTAVQSKSFEIR